MRQVSEMGQVRDELRFLCIFRSNLYNIPATTCSVKVPTGSIAQFWSRPLSADFSFLVANSRISWGTEAISSGKPQHSAAAGEGNINAMKEIKMTGKQLFIIQMF